MTLTSVELSSILKQTIKDYEESADLANVGTVISVSNNTANVYGIDQSKLGELIEFENGTLGLCTKIFTTYKYILLLSNGAVIEEGSTVKTTGNLLDIPIGNELLGRVIDALGNPIDGKGIINASKSKFIFTKAPRLMARKSISEPLQTGIMAIDALIPIGRGQNQLIIGDRQTGKTSIAINAILNQKKINDEMEDDSKKVYCIYVSIGKSKSEVSPIVKILEEKGAMDYTTIVIATEADSLGMQYIAPYVGCTIGEYFRDNEKHALIIYDDLTSHAIATRIFNRNIQEFDLYGHFKNSEIGFRLIEKEKLKYHNSNKLLKKDYLNIYANLFERSSMLNQDHGQGSLTSLSIIQSQQNNFIKTFSNNIISISDGQIFLNKKLLNYDIKTNININFKISVSYIGYSIQSMLMKLITQKIKLRLIKFYEIIDFLGINISDILNLVSHSKLNLNIKETNNNIINFIYSKIHLKQTFGNNINYILNSESQNIINRGVKIIELLKQDHYSVLSYEEQIILLFACDNLYLDNISTNEIINFKINLIENFNEDNNILKKIKSNQGIKEIEIFIEKEIKKFIEKI